MKTSELTGAALDWAVAKCEGFEPFTDGISWMIDLAGVYQPLPRYSSDWSSGGPIIERERIDLASIEGGEWEATSYGGESPVDKYGPTPLVAAMRAYVASKLGGRVEVPDAIL